MHQINSKKHSVPADYDSVHRVEFLGKTMTIYRKKVGYIEYWWSQLSNKWIRDSIPTP